jgi:hypothetical protein
MGRGDAGGYRSANGNHGGHRFEVDYEGKEIGAKRMKAYRVMGILWLWLGQIGSQIWFQWLKLFGLAATARSEEKVVPGSGNDPLSGRYTLHAPPHTVCRKPPPGWLCSREGDHDGPCAASPLALDKLDE